MDRLIFSQKAVYRLQLLASQVYRESGVRHKLSREPELLKMLRDSVSSRNPDVRRCYEDFIVELNKPQIDVLVEQGVRIQTSGAESIRRQAS